MKPADAGACPCGRLDAKRRPLNWNACCGRYVDHFSSAPAPDAESLMRSRYSAFVRERAGYLLATWAPSHRPVALDFEPGCQWLGLDVRAHRMLDGTHAEVEFIARSRLRGRATRLHERSRFVRAHDADGTARWFYVDGEIFE
ncbi:YchJ family protein [Ottowia testudinis]|uniref:YchJ-like middle NTF2-like domain-containing protein n=1 Tax=Ottowia testudinis TaxID=2816950 RepID=A0A975H309_9BURK|nr:YchJ family metal-binding protein [Ottowia testudinis]QTD45334.1 hypothetical protein J1M35_20365 [Ottowia testudinis]